MKGAQETRVLVRMGNGACGSDETKGRNGGYLELQESKLKLQEK